LSGQFPTNEGTLKDALYYLHKQSGVNDDVVRGVIRGLVCGMMGFGYTFEETMRYIRSYVNSHFERKHFRDMHEILPECWHDEYFRRTK